MCKPAIMWVRTIVCLISNSRSTLLSTHFIIRKKRKTRPPVPRGRITMPIDVLAFGPHPDDVELFCGGLLLKLKKQGYRTAIADMTRGELGTRGTVEIRAAEAAEAARILKADQRLNLDIADGGVRAEDGQKSKVVEVLRRLRPRIVLAPYFQDRHPDHVQGARLIEEAVFLSGVAKWHPGLEPWRPHAVIHYFMHRVDSPSFIVDISGEMEEKLRAVKAYKSQFHDPASAEPETYISSPAFLESVKTRAAYFGFKIGVEYGEPFFVKSPLRIDNIMTLVP
ncbi:MAG TPA: bacillithiol biosynthesis deacetylase BshB1 [Caldithrix abyssi]|uniref:Bacillithiol biosynthesis deacetylase BshB1 n=1 Tax=Caldithrix abyssi TaxID=187145 RepID=A0A7V1PUJ3_CALAY|nr:bacillithiol biosynthesis deacetylase BshB1 [Caldithrix abyssi]